MLGAAVMVCLRLGRTCAAAAAAAQGTAKPSSCVSRCTKRFRSRPASGFVAAEQIPRVDMTVQKMRRKDDPGEITFRD